VASGDGVRVALSGTSPKSPASTPAELLRVFVVADAAVVATLDLEIAAHTHWQFGAATVTADGVADPPGPGLSTHSAPGMGLTLSRVGDGPSQS
jgi:hypothetical protein